MATQTADSPQPRPKGRILRLLGLLAGSAALVGAGFGAGFFYFANPLSPAEDVLRLIAPEAAAPDAAAEATEDDGEGHKKVPKPVPEQELFVTSYFTFPEPLTSNLSGSSRFLQLTVGVSTQYDPAVIANVEAHVPALTSDILGVVSTFTEEQVAGIAGRKALAGAIRAAINARLERMEGFGGIEDVFFPTFVMQ
jgi:flagellar FliL protein